MSLCAALLLFQNQQRELTIRHARETEKEMKKRLDVQKVEYEDTIKRHLAFIDQVSCLILTLYIFMCSQMIMMSLTENTGVSLLEFLHPCGS